MNRKTVGPCSMCFETVVLDDDCKQSEAKCEKCKSSNDAEKDISSILKLTQVSSYDNISLASLNNLLIDNIDEFFIWKDCEECKGKFAFVVEGRCYYCSRLSSKA